MTYSGKNFEEMGEDELLSHYRELWNKIDQVQSESKIRGIQAELKQIRNHLVHERGWQRGKANYLVGQHGKLEFPESPREPVDHSNRKPVCECDEPEPENLGEGLPVEMKVCQKCNGVIE